MINFIKAIYYFNKLRTDRPEDKPKRVSKIINLFGTKRYLKKRAKFFSNPENTELLYRNKTLYTLLKDYKQFRNYKEGTLGKELYNFLSSEEVDYAKIIADFADFNDEYGKREKSMHDIIHVVFGYSRSRFGEGATLITDYWQGNSFGFAFITLLALIRQSILKPSAAPIMFTALKDVYKRQQGIGLHLYPFEDNLKKDINQVRKELRIPAKTKAIYISEKYSSWG